MMIKVGDIFKNNEGCVCRVEQYIRNNDITVSWLEYGNKTSNTNAFGLKTGQIKNPFFPSVYGVGYLGVGKYTATSGGKKNREYTVWHAMLTRCYNSVSLSGRPTYRGVEVVEDWKCFQNFAEWCQNQIGFNEKQFCLDKDILSGAGNNKSYGPATSRFIPSKLNGFFICSKKTRGTTPIGVYFDKLKLKFISSCQYEGKQKKLGSFDSCQEAFIVYKNFKESVAKQYAKLYLGVVDNLIIEKLNNYKVSIED